MSTVPINPGDLLQYVLGDTSPELSQLIRSSPEAMRQADELLEADKALSMLLRSEAPSIEQDMVDVAVGQATANQRLRVAAYVRQNPRAQAELDALKREYALITGKKPEPVARKASFPAMPILGLRGVRAQEQVGQQRELAFEVVELDAQVTLRMTHPEGNFWALSGYVTVDGVPGAGAGITLRGTTSDLRRRRKCDEAGTFSFSRLAPGDYSLLVTVDKGRLVVPELRLRE